MAGGRTYAAIDRLGDGIFVDSQLKGLADVDVVERLVQVVHVQVVDGQFAELVVLFDLQRCLLVVFGRDRREVDLVRIVGRVGSLRRLVEVHVNFLQLGLRAIVVGVRNEDNAGG